jgi:hypothetical protein
MDSRSIADCIEKRQDIGEHAHHGTKTLIHDVDALIDGASSVMRDVKAHFDLYQITSSSGVRGNKSASGGKNTQNGSTLT